MHRIERWGALDFVKAIGVLLMVILHVVVWWYIPLDYGAKNISDKFFVFLPFLKFIGLFVIIIPITAGASLRFYLTRSKLVKVKNQKLKKIFNRSVLLVILGYSLNLLAWGEEEFLNWDVLQFVGVGMVLAALMAKFLPISFFGVVGAFVLLSASFLRQILDSWKLNYFVAVLVSNNEGNFFWPFFPWFVFIAYGFLIADFYIKNRMSKRFCLVLFLVSIFVLMFAYNSEKLFFNEDIGNIWGPGIFQASALTLLGNIGIFNILLVVWDLSFRNRKSLKYGFLNTFSKGVLWIYVLHIIIGFHLVNYVKASISESVAFMLAIMIVMVLLSYMIGVVVVWQRERKMPVF